MAVQQRYEANTTGRRLMPASLAGPAAGGQRRNFLGQDRLDFVERKLKVG